ncbi:type-F conjugative transfer system pilin assembly protein TrbC [Salmonella enterica]|uniref:type-F conjugative transfer system pilin assembly protein TrbC n=1 Tax=Salmonella enterica TaxID=28901 RepID=UPI0003BCA313|nr:type-F conjugative transfer system pilin assembly protein TrbC [Salmonella enterica]ECF6720873.1 type-F conjugative transfer system pilin assembly protein TrbC [Salmonella enterica subsp. enterica]ESH16369.1 conjugal transfer pilus assembly protein TrbC [Salmonella enterica subsp. enterica serovar Gaminara str. ATCC BAA-711]ATQ05222.1 type-F conjugative transfer system pilin assembly protein TrbC [Salmonella enterica subsp. enterica serovar Gaminara]EAO0630692.1 type-F conjugative transfer s
MKTAYLQALIFSVLCCCMSYAMASMQTDISVSDRDWIKAQQDAQKEMLNKPPVRLPVNQSQQNLINRLQADIVSQQAAVKGKDTFPAIYFVSLGIPREGLLLMLNDARRYNIPPTIRGLVNNDMRQTAAMMFELNKQGNDVGVQIDPTLFTEYNIRVVPALVVTCPGHHDVIRGSLPLRQALEKVAESGDCAETARTLLEAAR